MTEELKQAFDEGWRMAAEWANRDDLVPDMDSPQYAAERDDRLPTLTQRPQAVLMTWELLTDERIKSEDFNGMYWLALKNGTVTTGCYQWRQGHNPYGFNTEEQGRVIASDVSHIVPLAEPAHPGITAQAKR